MKARTKIILSVSTVFVLIFLYGVWLLAPRGRYPNAERYDFYVDDTTLIKVLNSFQKKYPEYVTDSIHAQYHNFLPSSGTSDYGEFTFRSKKYNVFYIVEYKTRIAGYLRTTVAFIGVQYDKNGYFYRLNENLNDEESEKYIQDFETSILPLLEKELRTKTVKN
jgi:hypothetical protein